MNKMDHLILDMIEFDLGEPKLIQHFIKVHEFARLIGTMEKLAEKELETLEAAAVVHDIGIIICKQKYGRWEGKLQEEEGPPYAMKLLNKRGFKQELVERVSYLVGHHHTYSNIDGMDYRILVEADFLVNLYEDQCSEEVIQSAYNNIFVTESGRQLCRQIFGAKNMA